MPGERKVALRYFVPGVVSPVQAAVECDDPASPAFVPLTERSVIEQMRWWARREGKTREPKVELDPPGSAW